MRSSDKIIQRLAMVLLFAPLLVGMTPDTRLEQAVAAQRAMVAEQPDNAGALNDLGNLLVETGRLDEAEEAYRRAMQLGPDRPEPPFNLSLLLSARHRPKEARRLLKAMLEEHPEHAWGHYQMGTLHQARGNRSRALSSYREAFRLDPSLSDPQRNPAVLDNNLATAAMLEAFAKIGAAKINQRIYVEPRHITGLLLPPLTSDPEPMADSEAPAEELGEEMGEEMTEEVVAPPGG